ncbi:MAG: formylglycine-generating enzyme family protein [Anaerolineae bacterium]
MLDLLKRLNDASCSHEERARIGDQLAAMGDPRPGVGLRADGIPDIAWCAVDIPPEQRGTSRPFFNERGEQYGEFALEPFQIARYPITFAQFEAFLLAEDGIGEARWWEGLPERWQGQAHYLLPGRVPAGSQPRDTVSWVQAVAFTRWLSARLQGENTIVRLPLEWEWQYAAEGQERRRYPFGAWDERFANTRSARLGRTTAVGMYPQAVSWCGAHDMSGGVWEWCLNEYKSPKNTRLDGEAARILRGGSFVDVPEYAVCGSRFNDLPNRRLDYYGFRVVCARL